MPNDKKSNAGLIFIPFVLPAADRFLYPFLKECGWPSCVCLLSKMVDKFCEELKFPQITQIFWISHQIHSLWIKGSVQEDSLTKWLGLDLRRLLANHSIKKSKVWANIYHEETTVRCRPWFIDRQTSNGTCDTRSQPQLQCPPQQDDTRR